MAFPQEYLFQYVSVFVMFCIWFITLAPIRYAQTQAREGLDNLNPRAQYDKFVRRKGIFQRTILYIVNMSEYIS